MNLLDKDSASNHFPDPIKFMESNKASLQNNLSNNGCKDKSIQDEIHQEIISLLELLKDNRTNEQKTKEILNRFFEQLPQKYEEVVVLIIENHILEAITYNDTFLYAHNWLVQKGNREETAPMLRDFKTINKLELFQLIEEEKAFLHSNSNDQRIDTPNEKLKTIKTNKTKVDKDPNPILNFINKEIVNDLYDELKVFFPNREEDLLRALSGQQVTKHLVFPSRANKFIEVFRRLSYNQFIINNYTEIRDWICFNFKYYSKGIEKPFNGSFVYDNLRGKVELARNSRILNNLNWLPFKQKSLLEKEQKERKIEK